MKDSTDVYLRCRVGREWYAIHVDLVIRVLHLVALTELPDPRPEVLGLLTLPNQVAPVIDLRRRFGLAEAALNLETPIVAINTPHGAIGLVVDEADDIESIASAQIAPFSDGVSPYVVAVARCEDRLLLILNTFMLGAEARSEGQLSQASMNNMRQEA